MFQQDSVHRRGALKTKSAVIVLLESMLGEQPLYGQAGGWKGHRSGLLEGCSPIEPKGSTPETAEFRDSDVTLI